MLRMSIHHLGNLQDQVDFNGHPSDLEGLQLLSVCSSETVEEADADGDFIVYERLDSFIDAAARDSQWAE